MTPLSIILRGTREKYEYLGEIETKKDTILTRWSVAQASSNDEKNWGSKISLDCPFKESDFEQKSKERNSKERKSKRAKSGRAKEQRAIDRKSKSAKELRAKERNVKE